VGARTRDVIKVLEPLSDGGGDDDDEEGDDPND
jgi:hypothetical protein